MNEQSPASETCTVCGKAIDGTSGLAHVYHDGRRFALCCPMCLQMFERAPDRFARGEHPRTLLDELIDRTSWKNPDP